MAALFCAPIGWLGDFMFPDDRPSPIFATFSCFLNFGAILWSGIILGTSSCVSDTVMWLVLGILTCVANIVFGIYLYFRFAQKVKSMSASEAAGKLFLYDWGVCLYILVLIWTIVWMALVGGYQQKAGPNDKCGQQLTTMTVFLVIYLVVGALLVVLSLVTECCREPKWKKRQRNGDAGTLPAPGIGRAQAAPPQQQRSGGLFGGFTNLFRPQPAAPPPPAQPGPPIVVAQPAPTYAYAPAAQPVTYAPPPVNPAYQGR